MIAQPHFFGGKVRIQTSSLHFNRSCRTGLRTGTKAGFYKGTEGGTVVPFLNFSVRFNPYFDQKGELLFNFICIATLRVDEWMGSLSPGYLLEDHRMSLD